MLPRTPFALMMVATLLAPGIASAGLESELVRDNDSLPMQVVESPREARSFGLPNVSEFDALAVHTGPTTITRYPAEAIQERDD